MYDVNPSGMPMNSVYTAYCRVHQIGGFETLDMLTRGAKVCSELFNHPSGGSRIGHFDCIPTRTSTGSGYT